MSESITGTGPGVVDAGHQRPVETWVCVQCRARVPLADDVCAGCGYDLRADLALGRPSSRGRPEGLGTRSWLLVLRELVVLDLLFVLWRVVGHVSVFHGVGALARGRDLWRAERWLHLPSEASLQRPVLAHPLLARAADDYYAWAHAGVLVVVLVWLLLRHRDAYPRWRTRLVVVTVVSLLVGLLPVAPPRLVPGLGLVDLAARYHQSVYDSSIKGVTDQLSAMPSVHIAWAALVALMVVAVSTSRWRWLAVAYPVLTLWVVVVTANHYWLDAVAGLAVTLVVVLGDRARRDRRRARASIVPLVP